MPSRPPAAILALVLAGCTAATPVQATVPDDAPFVTRPPRLMPPKRPKPTQAQYEAAWVLVGDPPPLGSVPTACLLSPPEEFDPTMTYCNPPPPKPMPQPPPEPGN